MPFLTSFVGAPSNASERRCTSKLSAASKRCRTKTLMQASAGPSRRCCKQVLPQERASPQASAAASAATGAATALRLLLPLVQARAHLLPRSCDIRRSDPLSGRREDNQEGGPIFSLWRRCFHSEYRGAQVRSDVCLLVLAAASVSAACRCCCCAVLHR